MLDPLYKMDFPFLYVLFTALGITSADNCLFRETEEASDSRGEEKAEESRELLFDY